MGASSNLNSSEDDIVGESMVVCGKRKVAIPLGHSNSKKAKHQEGIESEDEEDEDSSDSEEEDSSELEEDTKSSLDNVMPQEGHTISKLGCEETKGRARVWGAFSGTGASLMLHQTSVR